MIDVQTQNLKPTRDRLHQAPRVLQDLIEKNLRALGMVTAAKMRRVMRPMKYTGGTENSVSSEISITGTRFVLEVGPTGRVAEIMRTGTRPHWAPIEQLKRWAYWKLGSEKAAYAIQRSIAYHGTSRWLARRGVPGAEQTSYGIGLDYPGETLKRGDMQQGIQRTANRIGLGLKVWIEDGVRQSSTSGNEGE